MTGIHIPESLMAAVNAGKLTADEARAALGGKKTRQYGIPKALSPGEEMFALHMKAHGLSPLREYKFHPERDWRLDFFWPYALGSKHLAVEIDGGIYTGGRHTRGSGYERDCEKLNAAAMIGIFVLRYTTAMVKSGIAARQVTKLLGFA